MDLPFSQQTINVRKRIAKVFSLCLMLYIFHANRNCNVHSTPMAVDVHRSTISLENAQISDYGILPWGRGPHPQVGEWTCSKWICHQLLQQVDYPGHPEPRLGRYEAWSRRSIVLTPPKALCIKEAHLIRADTIGLTQKTMPRWLFWRSYQCHAVLVGAIWPTKVKLGSVLRKMHSSDPAYQALQNERRTRGWQKSRLAPIRSWNLFICCFTKVRLCYLKMST